MTINETFNFTIDLGKSRHGSIKEICDCSLNNITLQNLSFFLILSSFFIQFKYLFEIHKKNYHYPRETMIVFIIQALFYHIVSFSARLMLFFQNFSQIQFFIGETISQMITVGTILIILRRGKII